MGVSVKRIRISFFAVLVISLALGQSTLASAATRASLNINPGTVSVSGAYEVDARLRANLSGWNQLGLTFTYQWYRNGLAIKGAKSVEYTQTQADFEFDPYYGGPSENRLNLSVTVTASGAGYKKLSVSSAIVLATSGKPCTLIGTEDSNIFYGTKSKDVICGLGGDDKFLYTKGPDFLDGGLGSDFVIMSDEVKPATVDLTKGTAQVKGGTLNSLASIENVVTGLGADRVIGTDGDNIIKTGNSEYYEESGDYVDAKGGNDSINTGGGNDTVYAGDGDDSVIGGYGDDSIDGGAGTNYCDETDSFDDAYLNCTEYTGLPTLVSVEMPTHAVGEVRVTVNDRLSATQSVNLRLSNGSSYTIAYEFVPRLISWNGNQTVWGFTYSEDFDEFGSGGSALSANAPGEWTIGVVVSTDDHRFSLFNGQSDGTYHGYDLSKYWYYQDVPVDATPYWTSGNIGATSVVLNWDDQAPDVNVATLVSSSLDVSTADGTATVHLAVTDNVSHVFKAQCVAMDFRDNVDRGFKIGTSTFTDAGDCTAVIPKGTPTGTYGMWIEVSDEIGNQTRLYSLPDHTFVQTQGREFDSENTVIDLVESTPANYNQDIQLEFTETALGNELSPELAQITWSVAQVSTRTTSPNVSATLQFNGMERDAGQVTCVLTSPKSRGQAIPAEVIPDSLLAGKFVASFTLPKKYPKGRYAITCQAVDGNGWKSTFIGNADGTFTTSGVNSLTPVTNVGLTYLVVG